MKKIKKLLGSLGIFLVSIKSKVFAAGYEIPDQFVEVKYGTFEPTIAEKFSVITKLVLPIILFFIGLGVILSKKISKKKSFSFFYTQDFPLFSFAIRLFCHGFVPILRPKTFP